MHPVCSFHLCPVRHIYGFESSLCSADCMEFRKSNHPHRQAFSGLVRFYIIIIIIKIVYCVQRGTFDGSKRYNANIQRKYRSQQKRAPWQILTYLHGEPPLKRHDTPGKQPDITCIFDSHMCSRIGYIEVASDMSQKHLSFVHRIFD